MGISVPFQTFPYMVDKISHVLTLFLSENRMISFPCHTLKMLKTFHQPGWDLPGTTGALHSRLWRVQEDTFAQSQVSDCILKASLLLSICRTKHLLVTFVKLIWYWYVWSVLVSMRVISLSQCVGCRPFWIDLRTHKIALTICLIYQHQPVLWAF